MADKLDLRRDPVYRAPRDGFVEVDVPPMRFLQIDGTGSPEGDEYARAVEALYALSYPVKFASKAEGRDYVVCPLEGLWWSDRMASFLDRSKDEWSWTMMIRQPGWVTDAMVDGVRDRAIAKAPAAASVRLADLHEGRCLQIMHHGSFEDETPVLARLHDEVVPERGLVMTGHHHEIYFTDPRRTAPERLRTLLRQLVARR